MMKRLYKSTAKWYYTTKGHHPEMPLYIEIMPRERLVRVYDETDYPPGLQMGCSGIKTAELARASFRGDWQAEYKALKEFAARMLKERKWTIVALIDGKEQ